LSSDESARLRERERGYPHPEGHRAVAQGALQIEFRFAPLLQLDSHGLFVPIDRDAYMAATDVDEHNRKLAPLFEAKQSPMTTTLTAKEGRLPALAPLPLPDQGPLLDARQAASVGPEVGNRSPRADWQYLHWRQQT
jgi:hypothetical protein